MAVSDLRVAGRDRLHVRLAEVVEVLLDLEVRGAGGQMQRRRGRDRAADIVRRHLHVVALGPGGDLARLQDAADGGDVRLHHVRRLPLEQLPELMPQGVTPGSPTSAAARSNSSRNSCRTWMRSPVATGIDTRWATFSSAARFSGGTGSSIHEGLKRSRSRAREIAVAG